MNRYWNLYYPHILEVENLREMSKKLNEFVRDVDEADGDIYGIGTYEAY